MFAPAQYSQVNYKQRVSADWWLSGSAVDLKFTSSQYYDGADGADVTTLLSIVRASVGYAQDSSNAWIPFAANQLRITDLGLLIEDARTNYLLNSGAPVTQTTASLATGVYTLWVEGSGSALASAGSASITGAASASAGAPNQFTVTVAGTVIVTVTGSLTLFQLELGAFASSYIPTTSAAATRARDTVAATGSLNTLFSAAAVSAVADIKTIHDTPVPGEAWVILGDNTGTEKAFISVDDQGDQVNQFLTGSASATIGGALTSDDGIKVGGSWNASATSIVAQGGTVGNGAAFTAGIASMSLGGEIQARFRIYGYFRRLTAWNTRLADATLQGFTNP